MTRKEIEVDEARHRLLLAKGCQLGQGRCPGATLRQTITPRQARAIDVRERVARAADDPASPVLPRTARERTYAEKLRDGFGMLEDYHG